MPEYFLEFPRVKSTSFKIDAYQLAPTRGPALLELTSAIGGMCMNYSSPRTQ